MKRIYIAGKLADYAPKYNMNRKRMMQTAIEVYQAGFSVYVPAMVEQLALMDEEDWDYDDYFNNSQPWLEVSDAVFLTPGWETSEGTKKEIKRAKELGIPVFDCIDCMIEYFSPKSEYNINPSPTVVNTPDIKFYTTNDTNTINWNEFNEENMYGTIFSNNVKATNENE